MTTNSGRPEMDDPVKASAVPFNREQFLLKTNASLKRIERASLILLCLQGGVGFFISKTAGMSLLLGGSLAALHFRSLHRMFQMRVLAPKAWLKTKFIYSVSLFLLISFFFWGIQWEKINTHQVVVGFFLMTGSVFFDTTRKDR